MNLHEYQAKKIFREEYLLPVPKGEVVHDSDQAELKRVMNRVSDPSLGWVVKAQVHAGGRGEAGGVKILKEEQAVFKAVKDMMGSRLVTYQTDDQGQPIHTILIEQPCTIVREFYLGAVVDRVKKKIVFMVSCEGGVDIEKVASKSPERIYKIVVDLLFGVLPYQSRYLAQQLKLDRLQSKQFHDVISKLYLLFTQKDCSLLEVNPLVIDSSGHLLCLDAKINIDDNALYRQALLGSLRDLSQEDERERDARQSNLSYIALKGDIGCMVNGAGLAMATMDLIKLYGGRPANFLDVGGTATQERVTEAFKIILSDQHVKAIFINIFGGIVRCDLIAEGIIQAVAQQHISVPVIIRLEGNRSDVALEILQQNSTLNIKAVQGFSEAAQAVVEAAAAV